MPPSRYVYNGAEVFSEDSSDDSEDETDSSSEEDTENSLDSSRCSTSGVTNSLDKPSEQSKSLSSCKVVNGNPSSSYIELAADEILDNVENSSEISSKSKTNVQEDIPQEDIPQESVNHNIDDEQLSVKTNIETI